MKAAEENLEIAEDVKRSKEKINATALIKNAKAFEKKNDIHMAIKSYENALSICISENNTADVFTLSMKLGDFYQLGGKLEEGMQYFQQAKAAAENLKNKALLIDALNKTADSYISCYEIENALKYSEEASKILNEIDYLKGKIENNIGMSRIYNIKKEYFKARELCNETLLLCGDNFPLFKGKLYISLADLYKNMTSPEEHLELLSQAYECFEKADYERGLFGVINNIAIVYAEKLHDYEKALEYYKKLKKLCEGSIYVEFLKICYLNIGEVNLKCFNYKKSLSWLNKAIKMPSGAYADNILAYNYVFLVQANLKLYNYTEAYDFLMKAEKEIGKNSNTEYTLVQYYKAAALIFNEFGDTNCAKSYIKKALDSVEKDETLIKWNIGIIYEYLKLSEAKNEADVIDIVDGVSYALSKYKNNDQILESVYNITIALIDCNYDKIALNFLSKYNSMKPAYEILKLKKMFIDIKLSKSNDEKLLIKALKLAEEIRDVNFEWKLSCLIGDYYLKNDGAKEALNYYNLAFKVVEEMVLSVPEKYRIQYANSSKALEAYNKLVMAMHYNSMIELKTCKAITSMDQLNEIFNYTN
ncbi:tetratricopeptide repeat protein [Candidatus Clostridium stratigraminis]|uniref:Tetratricopeptide repeat protein n=1 Tax=Candidatus Clostridium stratigraminis TaxID=3381661 RepID=A0ABW8T4W0_9CLOT